MGILSHFIELMDEALEEDHLVHVLIDELKALLLHERE